jgi:hypothetical protein
VTAVHHPYVVGKKGRSIRGAPGGHQLATLVCACGATHDIRFRQLAGSDQIDRKFRQAGWRLDPAVCPGCTSSRESKTMAAPIPTAAAIKAQAKMFHLIQTHFDAENGCYGGGWSDAKIAADVGLSSDTIAAFRVEAFGPLKEPPEVARLTSDIAALEQLFNEAMAPIQSELIQLRTRVAEVRRKFAA